MAGTSNLSDVLSSIRRLINTDSAEQCDKHSLDSPLIQSLKSNLEMCRDQSVVQTDYSTSLVIESDLETFSSTLSVYIQFVRESLCLLSILNDILKDLFTRDSEDATTAQNTQPPRALLSVADLKIVNTLLQFVVSLGIYPYLSPKIDQTLATKLSNVKSLEKMHKLPDKVKSYLLYECTKVLINLFENPVIGATIRLKHLSEVLAALIQICYAPLNVSHSISPGAQVLETQGNIGHQHKASSVQAKEISASQQEWCIDTFQKILRQSYQPLVIRELLALQRLSAEQGKKSQNWVVRTCGKLLSERMMDKNGVLSLLKAMFDSSGSANVSGDNWKKCQAVAMVIASCPSQALSVKHYYSIVCPQVLSLFGFNEKSGEFFHVAVAILSVMLTKQKELAMMYLVQPLLSPLSLLCSGSFSVSKSGMSLISCLESLHKVVCTVELSSPLLRILLPYCPMLFNLWLARQEKSQSKPSVLAKEILSQVLKASSNTEVLCFLCYTCGFQLFQAEHISFKALDPALKIVYATIGSKHTLRVEILSQKEMLECLSAEEVERVGRHLVAFLSSEQDKLIGSFFLLCLQFLTSNIAKQVGVAYEVSFSNLEESQSTDSNKSKTDSKHDQSTDTSSALLDCEARLPPTQIEAYKSSLVLYVTSSVCEELCPKLLQQISIPNLLSTVSVLVLCHASYCNGLANVLASKDLLVEMLGGSITLSISLGLLSAILSGTVEIMREHRPLLSKIQPSLATIVEGYPQEDLCSLASELQVCIATLGAVWSTEAGERAAAQMASAREAVIENIWALDKGHDSSTETTDNIRDDKAKFDSVSSLTQTPYTLALQEANDPFIPVKGHGLLSLTKLVESKDKQTLSNSEILLSLFTETLKHPDSYVYLAAINGLLSLAGVPAARDSVIAALCQGYAHLRGPAVNATGNHKTGQLKTKTSDEISSPDKLPSEVRMKLGEALVKVGRLCGDMLPHYLDQIAASLFSNINDPDPLIRTSSLSNLADLCVGVKFSLGRIQNEVLVCVTSILNTESDTRVRQAALTVIKLMLKCLSLDTMKIMGQELLDVYRLLKSVESTERDELTRAHAQAALGELDVIMKNLLFPNGSKELIKKISVLDVNAMS